MLKLVHRCLSLCLLFILGNIGFTFSKDTQDKNPPKELPNWEIGVSLPSNLENKDEVLAACKKSGFTWVEVYPSFNKGESPEDNLMAFKKALDKAGLKVWSVHLPYGKNNLCTVDETELKGAEKRLTDSLDLYKKTLGKYHRAVIHPSFEPVDPAERAEQLNTLHKSMKKWAPKVKKDYGVQLCIESLPRTCLINCSKEALDVLKNVPEGGLCFDTNHLADEKPHEFAQATAKRITTLHVCDYDGIREKHWIPGKGIIEWTPLVGALADAGYKGPIIFEVSSGSWQKEGTMPQFFEELTAAWKKIREDYAKSIQK